VDALGATLLLGAIAFAMFRALRQYGWTFYSSLCFALLVALVPSAQVIASWAVGWPYAVTALLAIGGFFAAEGGLTPGNTLGRSFAQWGVALGLMVVCLLIYQPSAMFYVVPLAAAVIAQRERSAKHTMRWVGIHLGIMTAALGLAYGIMSALYASGVFVKSGRIAFEQQWASKLDVVPAGDAAECAEPVRAQRQQSARSPALSDVRAARGARVDRRRGARMAPPRPRARTRLDWRRSAACRCSPAS
jgi:hypothetical protein